MVYYVDPQGGSREADGHSPAHPRSTYTDLPIAPGDTVLFKRGSLIRDRLYRTAGAPGRPITYGAYGEGENPTFCGSSDLSDAEKWREIRPCVWQYTESLPGEACNFIFDGGRSAGTLRWEEEDLRAQGDWYDVRCGCEGRYPAGTEEKLLLWSEGNPGQVYSHIECATWHIRELSVNRSWTVLEDLNFVNSGVHGLSTGADHVTVRRCAFRFIGGAVWNRGRRIRFGNAIEFWNHCEDVLVEDCFFDSIYDSCITYQGGAECEPSRRMTLRNNLLMRYGMAAYEGRDRMNADSEFSGNICLGAGGGFSAQGDTVPRNSEIYPQPMGHHLFMWRIESPTAGGGLEIHHNLFGSAAGASVYSIISPEAERQMYLHHNRYCTDNPDLLVHMGGRSYAPAAFGTYLQASGETDSEYASFDAAQAVRRWFARTGCSSAGADAETFSTVR